MNESAAHYILLSKADDLACALASLLDAHARQERLMRELHSVYNEAFHAAGIAQHIQGIGSQLAGLLQQSLEQTDGYMPKSDTFHQDLIRLASMGTSDRAPLIDDAGARHIKATFLFVHEVQSPFTSFVGDLEPSRVFQQIPTVAGAVQATVAGIRRMWRRTAAAPSPFKAA